MELSTRVADVHARFCGAFTHRYFVRAHMCVMLALVLLSGALAGRFLLRAGVANMGIRYPLTVVFSYAVFLSLVRLWLVYVCRTPGRRPGRSAGSSGESWSGSPWSGGSGSGSGSSEPSAEFAGDGGSSGGGGSSGFFGDGDAAAARSPLPVRMGSSGARSGVTSGGGGGGGGGDGDGIFLLILFALLVAAVFGAGAYVIYQAPAILSDTAFHAMLAGGLIRTAKDAHDPGWIGSIVKSTAIPFALVLVLAGVFGFEAHKRCPGASTAREVLRTCVF